jgi:hypothetical protein
MDDFVNQLSISSIHCHFGSMSCRFRSMNRHFATTHRRFRQSIVTLHQSVVTLRQSIVAFGRWIVTFGRFVVDFGEESSMSDDSPTLAWRGTVIGIGRSPLSFDRSIRRLHRGSMHPDTGLERTISGGSAAPSGAVFALSAHPVGALGSASLPTGYCPMRLRRRELRLCRRLRPVLRPINCYNLHSQN